MPINFITFLEAAIIASTLSLDSFMVGFSYGSNKINIPLLSVQIINIICSSILGLSLLAGSLLRPYLPHWLTITICFVILFLIGIIKLLDSLSKSIIKKYAALHKQIKVSLFNLRFILNIYADPKEGDADDSKRISLSEAASIAIALSLDGIAVGFGAALGEVNGGVVVLFSLFINVLFIHMGCALGNKLAKKLPFNISWIGGATLVFLAFSRLF